MTSKQIVTASPPLARQADLTIVVPCCDEAERVSRFEGAIDALMECSRGLTLELLLVDNGGEDNTAAMLDVLCETLHNRYPSRLRARVLRGRTDCGEGADLTQGVVVSKGRYVLTADAGMATPLDQLCEWIQERCLDLTTPADGQVVYVGSREHHDSVVEEKASRRLIRRLFNRCVQVVTDLQLGDTECGFNLYPGDLARTLFADLRERRWAYGVELLLMARLAGAEIVTLSVTWSASRSSRLRLLGNGWRMLWALFRVRLSLYRRYALGFGGSDELVARAPWDQRYERAALMLFVILLILVGATFTDYGVTWDEEFYQRYSEYVVSYYTTLGSPDHDRRALFYSDLYLFGPLFDVAGYIAARLLPFGEFESRHLLNALAGILGIVGAWRLARFLWGSRAGLLAALLLALTPTYYGHIFANAHDIPFAAAYIWAVYYLVRIVPQMPLIPLGLAVKLTAAVGAALAIRVGGLVLLCYLGAIVIVYLAVRLVLDRKLPAQMLSMMLQRLGLIFIGSWAIMVAFWPYALEQPLKGPWTALQQITMWTNTNFVQLYGGELIPMIPAPRDYIPRFLAIQLPEIVVGLLVLLPLMVAKKTFAVRSLKDLGHLAPLGIVLLATVFPMLYVFATGGVLYDGLRHLTFVLPLMAVLSAWVLDRVLVRVQRGTLPLQAVVGTALALYAGLHIAIMVGLHPYQYVYYNAFVGGIRGAAGRYELDYWAASFREATHEILQYVRESSPSTSAASPLRVYVENPKTPALYYFTDELESVEDEGLADFVLPMPRARRRDSYDAPALFTVSRFGVPLSYVLDQRLTARSTE